MASFEVKISLEALAAGKKLVTSGKDAKPPVFELELDGDWRRAVEQFTSQVLGDFPGQIEIADIGSSQDGLFPVLTIHARCYLGKAAPPLDKNHKWIAVGLEENTDKTTASGGTLDPSSVVELYTDGGSRGNPGPAGVGGALIQASSGWCEEFYRYIGHATNNVAEYTALLDGLKLAIRLGVRKLKHKADSQLMVRQLEGAYKVKSPELRPLFDEAKALIRSLESFSTGHVRRENNKRADELANMAMDQAETDGQ